MTRMKQERQAAAAAHDQQREWVAKGREQEKADTLALLREQLSTHQRALPHGALSPEAMARVGCKIELLRTLIGYIERGDQVGAVERNHNP